MSINKVMVILALAGGAGLAIGAVFHFSHFSSTTTLTSPDPAPSAPAASLTPPSSSLPIAASTTPARTATSTVSPVPVSLMPPAVPTPPAPLPAAASSDIASTSSAPASSSAPAPAAALAPRTINEAPNVGLLCHYQINDPAIRAAYAGSEDAEGELLAKGSGVIVNPKGYILTAKHIVDPQWTNQAYQATVSSDEAALNAALSFDYCDVGTPPDVTAPSNDTLQSINPSIAIANPFPYRATLAFDPPKGAMSDLEYDDLDFAVLKISSPMAQCQLFNLCTLPSSFSYSPVYYASAPDSSATPNVLVDFGYPAESINSSGSTFTDFYLKGTVGRLSEYYGGDRYFKDEPFVFQWEANDVLPGRSGSPVYWQGYVVGIDVSQSVDNSTIDTAVGIPAIQKVLEANGLGSVLATQ